MYGLRRARKRHIHRVQEWHNTRRKSLEVAKVKYLQKLYQTDATLRARDTGMALLKAYVICRNYEGGSWKYLLDIMDRYNHIDYIFISSLAALKTAPFREGDMIIIQYTMNTDIPLSALSQAIRAHKLLTILPLHDWYWFHNAQQLSAFQWYSTTFCHNSYLKRDVTIRPEVRELFALANIIIAPSKFISDGYKKAFGSSIPIHVVGHNDYPLGTPDLYVPEIQDRVINIGALTNAVPYKGIEVVEFLMAQLKSYRGYRINYCVVDRTIPRYPESGFFNHVRAYSVHCLLHLNKWGETYCYALTKTLMTGIPIFYNNLGAFRERLGDKAWHFKNIELEGAYPDLSGTISRFKKCLDYIISKQGTGKPPSDIPHLIEYRPFYDDIFKFAEAPGLPAVSTPLQRGCGLTILDL